ncbi:MAG: hypothetical protein JKY57_01390 [Kordiimonadaceae bacterium]|nr:hypothetical protein [Kordiimonadaceae bacterium]
MSSSLGYYDIGMTTQFACQFDQRFSYWMYVPKDYDENATKEYPVAVLVHGTHRRGMMYRDMFMEFGEKHKCIILAPQFPAGIEDPKDLGNYKFLKYRDIRFDTILLSMIDEISQKYRIAEKALMLFGFSGGAHFVHRFFYLHADRMIGLSVGAPGMVTLLDDSIKWHCGTGGMAEHFDQPILLNDMRKTPVQMVIGGDDTETWEITIKPSSPLWMEGANDAGTNRLERMVSLKTSFENNGIVVRHDIVPGIGHDSVPMMPSVQTFFADCLNKAGFNDASTTGGEG